jgi:Sulfatase
MTGRDARRAMAWTPVAVMTAMAICGCRSGPLVKPASTDRFAGRPIVLVTIDTLRADRLGSYGSARRLTPRLDAFARNAIRFTAAVAQVPLTLPSHAPLSSFRLWFPSNARSASRRKRRCLTTTRGPGVTSVSIATTAGTSRGRVFNGCFDSRERLVGCGAILVGPG